ncbi:hypothetical protein BDP81DRAFT_432668 [Colletotrichum phormii]|uniref:Uncharacterized protein n=1 Tax=Colletotrichum phormii TaxID=359342 RepID=A0AAI9ZLX1_9PEZI|nr:uncharacterized protein BDP81DRAFT_432668 [Colletotrichum phormii]KAK1634354.1 hypothetical protein BDP81DRAFT_432668 [Colletotrichum phormii]
MFSCHSFFLFGRILSIGLSLVWRDSVVGIANSGLVSFLIVIRSLGGSWYGGEDSGSGNRFVGAKDRNGWIL